MNQDQPTQKPRETFKKSWPSHLEDLKQLVRIPSISFDGFPKSEVIRSAEAVAQLLKRRGLENVEVLRFQNAHPYVVGDWLHAPGKPTVLLYAHHDVQPVGKEAVWKSPPFEPTVRQGPGGERLFGRGTADDKAGIIVHTAAIAAHLEALGKLPINIKVLIEGEEEIGSGHLAEFLKSHRKKLEADILILTDTANYDCGIPSLTVALRGLVGVDIEVRGLTKTIHSGMWGGPIADPVMGLCKMLASLVDEKGQVLIPEVANQVVPLSSEEIQQYNKLPYDEKLFREQAGVVPGAQLLKACPNPILQIWRLPSLTIHGIQAAERGKAGNIINDVAWARMSVRVAPGMDPEKVRLGLEKSLRERLPWGLDLNLKFETPASGWKAAKSGRSKKVFEAAHRALALGYGKEVVEWGCGGTIPFVQPLAEAFGLDLPVLMVGVEDPWTNAHGENESLLVSDLEKACVSQICLFDELGKV